MPPSDWLSSLDNLCAYYMAVGIIGLIFLALLMWVIIADNKIIKVNKELRKKIEQLQRQVHQVDSIGQNSRECPDANASTEGEPRQLADPGKFPDF